MKKREAKKQFKKASGKRARRFTVKGIRQNMQDGEEIVFAKRLLACGVVASDKNLYIIKWNFFSPNTEVIPFNTITQLSNRFGELKIMCGSNGFKVNSVSDKKIKQISKFIHSKIH